MVVGRAPVELEPVDLGGVVDGCDGPVGGEVRGRTAAQVTKPPAPTRIMGLPRYVIQSGGGDGILRGGTLFGGFLLENKKANIPYKKFLPASGGDQTPSIGDEKVNNGVAPWFSLCAWESPGAFLKLSLIHI